MLIASLNGNADLDMVARMRATLNREALGMHVSQDILDDLSLAVSELATNSVVHATVPPSVLAMDVHVEGTTLRIEIHDDGSPFADFNRRWADCQMAPMDAMAECGRGLWLIRTSVDQLAYETGAGNHWTLWRGFHGQEKPAILLVEDDALVRGLFVSVLSKMGRVDCAGSLAEAKHALAETRYDLVIADYNLGDGNSSELFGANPGSGRQLDTPFLFVTSDRTGEAREKGLHHGIHSVLTKPVRPRELQERAAEAIAAHRAHAVRAALRLAHDVEPTIAFRHAARLNGFHVISRGATAATGGGDILADLGFRGERHRLLLADCAGHGMPARLQAAMLSGIITALPAERTVQPHEFIEALSGAIYNGGMASGLVATVLVADLLEDGRIELATGGHPSPLVIGRDGTVRPVPLTGALPGLLARSGSRTHSLVLEAGERLLIATDGMAPDSSEILGGFGNLTAERISGSPDLTIAEAANSIEAAIMAEEGSYPADDWTFALIGRAG